MLWHYYILVNLNMRVVLRKIANRLIDYSSIARQSAGKTVRIRRAADSRPYSSRVPKQLLSSASANCDKVGTGLTVIIGIEASFLSGLSLRIHHFSK